MSIATAEPNTKRVKIPPRRKTVLKWTWVPGSRRTVRVTEHRGEQYTITRTPGTDRSSYTLTVRREGRIIAQARNYLLLDARVWAQGFSDARGDDMTRAKTAQKRYLRYLGVDSLRSLQKLNRQEES